MFAGTAFAYQRYYNGASWTPHPTIIIAKILFYIYFKPNPFKTSFVVTPS